MTVAVGNRVEEGKTLVEEARKQYAKSGLEKNDSAAKYC
jgi:hypothetical protein